MKTVELKNTIVVLRQNDIPQKHWVVDENGEWIDYDEEIRKAMREASSAIHQSIEEQIVYLAKQSIYFAK